MGEISQAAGSADAEMEIIRDSVAFKLNELKQTWIGYAQELLQRDDIGKIIDKLIEGSESLQSTLNALSPVVSGIISLLSDLIGVLANLSEVGDWTIPTLAGIGGAIGLDRHFDILNNIDTTNVDNLISKFKQKADKTNVDETILEKIVGSEDDVVDALQFIDNKPSSFFEGIEDAAEEAGKGIKNVTDVTNDMVKNTTEALTEGTKAASTFTDVLGKKLKALGAIVTSPAFWAAIAIAVIYKLGKAQDEIIEQTKELQKAYDADEEALENYRSQIEKLREIADNNNLSIAEQQEAREKLLDIQSQMVEKFGDEASQVDILTDSISRLNSAFDTLSDKKYQEFKLQVNEDEGWLNKLFHPIANYIEGYNDNWDRDISQMKNAKSGIFSSTLGAKGAISTKNNKVKARLLEEEGINTQVLSNGNTQLEEGQNLRNYYNALLNILDKYDKRRDEIGKNIYNDFDKEARRVKKLIEDIGPTNDTYLEKEIIESNKQYSNKVEQIKTAMENVYKARVDSDEEGLEYASKHLTQIYDDFIKTVEDPEVLNWFKNYVAEYEAIMNKTRFTNGLNNNANYQIAKINNKKYGYSKEELETAASMDDEAINNIADIHKRVIVQRIKMASHDAEIPVSVVIDQLEADKAAIAGLEKQLRDKFGDFKIDSLSPEDLEIVLNLSGALNMKWEDIQNEIYKAKKQMKEMSKIQMIDSLNDMSSGFDKLDEVYADVYDKGSFDFTTLASKKFEEAFAGLDAEVYSKFIETVSEYPDDLEKTQKAFNELAQAYIEHEGILEGLTEENKNVAIQMLKNMGIANAEEVVVASLTQAQEDLKLEKEYVETASEQLSDATVGEINAFIDEKNYSEQAKDALVVLALQKQLVNGTTLDFSGDIQNIINYITELGGATSALKRLQAAKSGANLSDQGYSGSMDEESRKKYLAQLEKSAQSEVDSILSEYKNKKVPQVQYNGGDKTRDAKDKASNSAAEDAELFDWIETKIQRLEREITNLGKTADATFKTWAERTVALGQEMEKVNEQIDLQQTAYATYMKQAEAIDLAQEYKNKVMNGTLDVESISDKTLKKNIKDFKEVYEKALAAKDKVDDLQSSLANLAKTKFDNISAQFDDLISDIDHGLKYVTAQLESVETVGKIAGKSFYEEQIKAEQQRVNDLTAELGQLQSALAEGLASGAIAYGSQMFNEMKSSIYSVEESILDANNAILKFEQNIKDVAKQNFDDLISQFENAISILTGKIDLTDKIVSMVQNTGHVASKAYYQAMIDGQDQNIKNLKKKESELTKVFEEAVANGDIEEYSENWYSMKNSIESVKGEILDAASALIEYKNAMRQIDWDLFDRGQTRLEQLVSESQFLIDLYGKYPLFDKETGNITDKGMATRGLLVQNYETYISQARQLQEEIAKLKEELKADPGSTTLIDRIKELEQAERDAILSSEGVKESLRDLLENEINALLEALQKLVDQYKKSLQAQKD